MKIYNEEYPDIHPDDDLRSFTEKIAESYEGEFCVSESFDPLFVSRLILEGYLPMSICEHRLGKYFLLPKLHRVRSILFFPRLDPGKTVRRVSRSYELRANRNWRETADACVEQHGDDWLTPPLLDALESISKDSKAGRSNGVRMVSFELIKDDGRIAAGEIGFAAGGIYTSLSGFRTEDSSGTVQLYATGLALEKAGFAFWDLGMPMKYKNDLGALMFSRRDFLYLWNEGKSLPSPELPEGPVGARDLITTRAPDAHNHTTVL